MYSYGILYENFFLAYSMVNSFSLLAIDASEPEGNSKGRDKPTFLASSSNKESLLRTGPSSGHPGDPQILLCPYVTWKHESEMPLLVFALMWALSHGSGTQEVCNLTDWSSNLSLHLIPQ